MNYLRFAAFAGSFAGLERFFSAAVVDQIRRFDSLCRAAIGPVEDIAVLRGDEFIFGRADTFCGSYHRSSIDVTDPGAGLIGGKISVDKCVNLLKNHMGNRSRHIIYRYCLHCCVCLPDIGFDIAMAPDWQGYFPC